MSARSDPCPDCGGPGHCPLLRRHLRAAALARAPRRAMNERRRGGHRRNRAARRCADRGAGAGGGPSHRAAAVAWSWRVGFRRRSPSGSRQAAFACLRPQPRGIGAEPRSDDRHRPARSRRRHRGRDRARRQRRRRSWSGTPSATGSRACSPPTGPTWCAAVSLVAANVGHAPSPPVVREAIKAQRQSGAA